ncbi:helix-turn-helix transcriptional regulator [Sinomicrobium sp. M5D2P9]
MLFSFNEKQWYYISYILSMMFSGNFDYRLKLSAKNNIFNDLIKIINHMSQLMALKTTGQEGTLLSNDLYGTMAFVLDDAFCILKANQNVDLHLSRFPDKLPGTPFATLLSQRNQTSWEYTQLQLPEGTRFLFTNLIYSVNAHGELPSLSFFFRSPDDGLLYLTSHKHSLIEEILDEKLSLAMKEVDDHIPIPRKTQNSEEELIHKIATYIREHLEEPWSSVKGLASKFGINEKKLKLGFHKWYNTSVYHYYINVRMEVAMKLLKTTDKSIQEIAYRTGYKVLSSFYRSFKQHFGCTPGEIQGKK